MTEDWEFYLKPVDDHPASIFVDLGQKEIAPDASRPWLLRVGVALQSRRDDGLSDRDEADVLNAIEDKLFVAVARGLRARYVGRITTQGRREHFYYGPSAAGFPEAVAAAMATFPSYESTSCDEEDREWTTYSEVLHPDALELESIQNRRVVDQLAREGDDLTEPREVDHWAYFPSEEARDRFLLQIAGNRFRSEPCPAEAPEGRLQYGVHLRRSDRVDFETIDAIAIDLFLRAADCEGEYDGWSSPVIRGN